MSRQEIDRRRFLAHSVGVSATAALAFGTSVSAAGEDPQGPAVVAPPPSGSEMPTGTIGDLTLSRLCSGGNLIGGWAHARDLDYVGNLMQNYNTDKKVLETLELMEKQGVNTIISDPSERLYRVLFEYWNKHGGKMQWIASAHPKPDNIAGPLQKVIDRGACAVYVQGVIGDRWWMSNRMDLLEKCLSYVKKQGLPAGIGAHELGVIKESENIGLDPDFYMKTLHHHDYWSARPSEMDTPVIKNFPGNNYWCRDPEGTVDVMKEVDKPWIAFKVLAAGAIPPVSGFEYALQAGADFLCVGMFDWQVEEDVQITHKKVAQAKQSGRDRPWRG